MTPRGPAARDWRTEARETLSDYQSDDSLTMCIENGIAAYTALASQLRAAEAREKRLQNYLSRIDQTLRVPAAEYVPAIGDAFKLIDKALAVPTRPETEEPK